VDLNRNSLNEWAYQKQSYWKYNRGSGKTLSCDTESVNIGSGSIESDAIGSCNRSGNTGSGNIESGSYLGQLVL